MLHRPGTFKSSTTIRRLGVSALKQPRAPEDLIRPPALPRVCTGRTPRARWGRRRSVDVWRAVPWPPRDPDVTSMHPNSCNPAHRGNFVERDQDKRGGSCRPRRGWNNTTEERAGSGPQSAQLRGARQQRAKPKAGASSQLRQLGLQTSPQLLK